MAHRGRSRNKSLILGITGGIACGKNAVAEIIAACAEGSVIIDTDDLAHELQAGPNPTYRKLLKRFGYDIVDVEGGPINRKKLAARVFGNDQALAELNGIMHPAITRVMKRRIKQHSQRRVPVIAVLVPLLFECGMESHFDEIWSVVVEESIQLARLMARNGLTEEQARMRIAAQMPQEEKARRSCCVIDNSGTLQQTADQIRAFLVDALWRHATRQGGC